MIEVTLRDWLASRLDVPVYLDIPQDAPSEYVTLERTGGGEEHHINRCTFAIQSIGASLYAAASINEEVKQEMKGIIEIDSISKVSLNTDYNFTDTTTKQYRYQAVYNIVHY